MAEFIRLAAGSLTACLMIYNAETQSRPQFINKLYSPSDANIGNPERGLFIQHNCATPVSQSTLTSYRNQGYTLIRCYINLGAFISSPIAQSALDSLQTQMDNLRGAGVKVILNFTYNWSDSNVDADLPRLTSHMDQLAPYLSRNKDVIAAIVAGFIGAYGEGDNSLNYGQTWRLTAQNIADRKTIAAKQLQTTPVERMIMLRTPAIKMTFDGSTPISASEAYNGSSKARHGHTNECFLSTPTDWGTYSNTSTEYPYLASDSTYTVVGGETCKLNQPRTDCPTALKELAMFHWSFLHLYYNVDVLNSWRNQGCFTEVQKKLGYRFVLQNGSYSMSAKPGGTFSANFTIKNVGWAAPFNARDVELIFRNTVTGTLYRSKLNTDPRRWLSGQSIDINQTITLPPDMAKGNYAVLLNLPDPMSPLRSRPEYSIQLANSNVWEANTGFNQLNHIVSVAQN